MIFPQKNERVIAEKIYPTDPTVENLMLYIKYIYIIMYYKYYIIYYIYVLKR